MFGDGTISIREMDEDYNLLSPEIVKILSLSIARG
jgi:hypothetical protein